MKRIRSLLPAKAATLLLLGCTGGDVSVNTDLSSVPLDIPALSILATSVGEVKVFDLSAEPPVTRLVAGGFDFPARSRAPQAALVPFGQFDQASGRLELTDFNAALYVSGQKLFVISLNQPDAPPQQVSSAENVCGIRDLFSDHADRSNSLVLIFRAAPDGRCFTSASPQALVRLGAPVSEDPITVSRDFRARSRVYDSSGRLRAILVLDRQPSSGMLELQRIALGAGPTTAQVLATRRTIIEIVEGQPGTNEFPVVNADRGSSVPGSGFLLRTRTSSAGRFQLLLYSDESLGVQPVVDYRYQDEATPFQTLIMRFDSAAQRLYFSDGPDVRVAQIDNLGSPLPRLFTGASSDRILQLALQGDRLIALERTLQSEAGPEGPVTRIRSIPVAGGTSVVLAQASAGESLEIAAVGAAGVFYNVFERERRVDPNTGQVSFVRRQTVAARQVGLTGSPASKAVGKAWGGVQRLSKAAGGSSPGAPPGSVLGKIPEDDLTLAARSDRIFLLRPEGEATFVDAVNVAEGAPGLPLGRVDRAFAIGGQSLGLKAVLRIDSTREDGGSESDIFLADVTRQNSLRAVAAVPGVAEINIGLVGECVQLSCD